MYSRLHYPKNWGWGVVVGLSLSQGGHSNNLKFLIDSQFLTKVIKRTCKLRRQETAQLHQLQFETCKQKYALQIMIAKTLLSAY